jgi:very-short-patch-repair endonuclease
MSQKQSERGEVLVAVMNNRLDFELAANQHWYRIPVSSVEKWLAKRWPPQWLAFYMTKKFGAEEFSVRYFARVVNIRKAYRWQLFPDQPSDQKSQKQYYQLLLEPLRPLPQPIFSRRWRRIVFIPTTWQKFMNAAEINDLYDDSPLEDLLWAQLKRLEIPAERQEREKVGKDTYLLDFAIYCARGKVDVETDGDVYHSNPEKAQIDNVRNNNLEAVGWSVLRFNTPQIKEQMETYCVPTIVEKINGLGGIEEKGVIPRQISITTPRQMSLFDKV